MKNEEIQSIDVFITFGDVEYEFTSVSSIDYADPQNVNLRVSPQGKGSGVIETTGLTSALTKTYVLYEVEDELIKRIEEAFVNRERISIKEISKKTDRSFSAKNAIIQANPRIGTKSDTGEAESVTLTIQFTRNNKKDEGI